MLPEFLWNGETGTRPPWPTGFDDWRFYDYFAGMNAPAVSVILPVYNCEKYIGEAIFSVLQQTLADLELIIINDGSSDNTEFAILDYPDPRIVYIKNQQNQGLVYSLNKGISLCRANYIARMDADDICLPERLEKQKNYLDQNKDIAVVATTIEFINDAGEKTGDWQLDKQTITPARIKRTMPGQNCIAHPTVMMRSEILKELKYKSYQKNTEDYDLWLRVLSLGHKIAKIDEPLLRYRLHEESITSMHLKKTNPFFTHLRMKLRLLTRSGNTSWFSIAILGSAMLDLVKGTGKELKNLFR